jgi:tetratricopeptide (TPR) repeat protein
MGRGGRRILWGSVVVGVATLATVIICATIAFRQIESCKQAVGSRAVDSCSKIIAHHGTAAWAYADRGSAYMGLHQTPLALNDFNTAIRLDPDGPTAYFRRGVLHASLKQTGAAIADFSATIRLQPTADKAFEYRAGMYLNLKQHARAIEDLNAALRLRPGDPDLRGERGMVYLANKQYELAIRDFDAGESKYRHNGPINFFRGLAYFELHQFDDALRNLDESVRIGATAERLTTRCYVRAMAGQELKAALADCDRAAKIDPKLDQTFDRSLILLRLGRLPGALSTLAAYLAKHPGDAGGLYLRGLAKTRSGDRAGGDADIRAAKSRDSGAVERLAGFGFK